MEKCIKCNEELDRDEIALHKKLFGKTATKFMCKSCVAKYLSVSVELLDEKIKQFKEVGCKLFIN